MLILVKALLSVNARFWMDYSVSAPMGVAVVLNCSYSPVFGFESYLMLTDGECRVCIRLFL